MERMFYVIGFADEDREDMISHVGLDTENATRLKNMLDAFLNHEDPSSFGEKSSEDPEGKGKRYATLMQKIVGPKKWSWMVAEPKDEPSRSR